MLKVQIRFNGGECDAEAREVRTFIRLHVSFADDAVLLVSSCTLLPT